MNIFTRQVKRNDLEFINSIFKSKFQLHENNIYVHVKLWLAFSVG